MEKRGIVPSDLWNMDETGFRCGCGKAQWVITFEAKKALRMVDPDIQHYITCVECINAAGEVIPPLIIMVGKCILEKWCLANDLPGGSIFGASESGYSDDKLALCWIKHFEVYSRRSQKGA